MCRAIFFVVIDFPQMLQSAVCLLFILLFKLSLSDPRTILYSFSPSLPMVVSIILAFAIPDPNGATLLWKFSIFIGAAEAESEGLIMLNVLAGAPSRWMKTFPVV